jgi:hypothetical protein
MRTLTQTLLLTALVLLSPALLAQEGGSFPGIESLMSAQEYKDAGIEKLTAAERKALNQWLIRYTAEDSQVLLSTDKEVIKATEVQEITSVIQQPFKGWFGDTVFKLENGQVWQQRRRGNYRYMGTRPEVKVTRNFMGFFSMELVENGKSVQVKRLK